MNGGKAEAAYEIGTLAVDVVRRDLRPSQVVTKEAVENAAAAIAGTGGSTNGVLHLVAIAHEFGIDFTIDDFDRISAATPIVADMKPWGRYHATDVYRAGGVGLVARELQQGLARPRGRRVRRRPHAHRRRRERGGDVGPDRRRSDRDPAQVARRRSRSCAATSRRRDAW